MSCEAPHRVLLLNLALIAVAGTDGCALVGNPCAAPVTGTSQTQRR